MSKRIFVWLAVLLVFAPCAWPQASTGSVSGTVRDQTGAVIPNTTVVMTFVSTNVKSTTRSDPAGVYFFPGVVAGSYQLSVESPGMQTYHSTFIVAVAQSVVIDPVLVPGATTAVVDVKDVTPMVVVDSPTLTNTMEMDRIDQLPTNGRTFTTFLNTLPGFEGTRTFGTIAGAQEWVLDGSNESDRHWANPPGLGNSCGSGTNCPNIPPGVESVQEFTVADNAISAKYSAAVSIVLSTKSGTNQFHGSLYETNRDNGVGLARARTDYYTKPPELVRNEFGGSVGGPVYIPKVYNGKNRTFWFASWEGERNVTDTTGSFQVPTVAMRNGDFSNLKDSLGRLQVLYDPMSTGADGTRTPFINNTIPIGRLNPVAKYMFGITPLPTNTANPMVDYNWYGPESSYYTSWTLSARVDHRFSEKDNMYARLNKDGVTQTYETSGYQQMLNNVAGYEVNKNPAESLAVSWVHIFSPTLFNELLLSGHHDAWFGGDLQSPVTKDWSQFLGLPEPFGSQGVANFPMWPEISTSANILGNYKLTTNNTKQNHQNYETLDENATKLYGRHELQFGMHVRRDQLNTYPITWPQVRLEYSTLATAELDTTSPPLSPTALPLTGGNIANMFLGVANYVDSLGHKWFYIRENEYAPYFQDNIKVNKRLTLNVGLRWEYWSPYSEKNGTMESFDLANHAVVLGTSLDNLYALGSSLPSLVSTYQALGMKFETPQQAGLPGDLMYGRKTNFGPRFGFAYKALEGKSAFVVRGGYSASFFHQPEYLWQDNANSNAPTAATYSYNPYTDATQSPNGLSNYGLISQPAVLAGVNSANVISVAHPTGITPGSSADYFWDPSMPAAKTQTWNLTLEKGLTQGLVARASYVGIHSSGLAAFYNLNPTTATYVWYATTHQALPTGTYANVATRAYDQQVYGTVSEFLGNGFNNNNGVSGILEHRFNHGYAFQFSYTLMDAFAATSEPGALNQYMPGIVPTDLDQRMRTLSYARDTAVPKQRIKWNFLLDLPFGKGKKFGGNSGRVLNGFIGGWQIAGIGSWRTTYVTLPTTNWNITGAPIQVYGYKYPIKNCTSGVCVPGYLWTNAGYIPKNLINTPNGYQGIPADYQPAETPLIPYGSTALPANAPANTNVSTYWDTNNVWIPLNDGTVVRTSYNNGLNPWRNQYIPGVLQWNQDASLFKNIAITERVGFRFQVDFFNVFNHPGNPNTVGADGFENTTASGNQPRDLQLSLRLHW